MSWDWVYAVATLDLHDVQREDPYFRYEIQGFRLGDLAVATLMGEPFVEAQLEIKRRSRATQTMVAHLCNGYAGYIPTAAALERGGYETWTANWSKFQPPALAAIAATGVKAVNRLFPA